MGSVNIHEAKTHFSRWSSGPRPARRSWTSTRGAMPRCCSAGTPPATGNGPPSCWTRHCVSPAGGSFPHDFPRCRQGEPDVMIRPAGSASTQTYGRGHDGRFHPGADQGVAPGGGPQTQGGTPRLITGLAIGTKLRRVSLDWQPGENRLVDFPSDIEGVPRLCVGR